jgi:hypothetical protein
LKPAPSLCRISAKFSTSSGAAATSAPLTANSIGLCGKISMVTRTFFITSVFRLVVHQRDFFYFRGKDSLSPQASRMAVFVFILIESLADQGEPVVDTLMTRTFSIPDLPHLKGARYRAYLKEAGAADEDELRGIVRQLERFGFIQRHTEDSFTFRTPAYRFFDVCIEILNRDEAPQTEEQGP